VVKNNSPLRTRRFTEQNSLCTSVPSVVKKTFTTENTEKHGAELSVYLCALCGEKNIHHGEHGDSRSRTLCAPLW